MTNISTIITR